MTETAGDKTTTKAYTYGDSEWLDLLTAINGSAIQYDAGGNPTNWNNGKADLSLQWANGRRLTGASSESARKSESLSYSYDADGIRTSKSYTVKTYNVIPDYVVTFVADGKTVKTMTVEQGYKLKDSDYPTVPAKTGYTGEWKKYTTAISTNVTVIAVYTTKVTARHTVTFKADGVVLKTMTVKTGYTLKTSDYPEIPAKEGYIGSWPANVRAIRADKVISAIYKSTDGGGITVPTRPSVEIMSVDEVEPVEAEAADENAVATRGTHLASTQTVTHEYLTQSGKVMRETVRTDGTVTSVLDFIYDESGKPFALVDQLSAQPNTYYYVLTLQGDVVKLVTESGAVAASYEYDAWGNILSQSGSMAEKNPLRYRGYYYDSETGFYYLQSRYYDPATRRFINADAVVTTNINSVTSCNMFAYCGNNPIMCVDETGNSWFSSIITAVAVVAVAAVATVAVVASAGTVACAAAGMAAAIGASAATTAAASTVATVGCYAVAAGVAACGLSDAGEALTGTNVVRDYVFKGNQGAYDDLRTGLAIATAGIFELANQAEAAGISCFVAGTLVCAADGQKAIEDICTGDLVWAWDEETGTVALKPVVETYVNETAELMHIFVDGEEIVATPTHPFYCPVKGWTDAAHLRAGDILVLVNGEYVVVEQVQHELLESPVKVYNFQVADYHTYYVASGVLVHNSCKRTSPRQMQKQVERGQAPKGVERVDTAHVSGAPNQYPHVHFTDGTSLNWDGSIHDKANGIPVLTQKIIAWLSKNNWSTKIK